MLKLLGRANSINVRKVLWLCTELDLKLAHEPWGAPGLSLQSPEFLALNPNAVVPVLIDGDFVLRESNTICRYLAAREGRADLLPTELRQRARVEQWMDWQATDLNQACRYAFLALVRKSPDFADAAAARASVERWTRLMLILNRTLDQSPNQTDGWLAGDGFTLADLTVGLTVNRWFMSPIDRPDLPAVTAYYERLSKRPGYRLHGRNGEP